MTTAFDWSAERDAIVKIHETLESDFLSTEHCKKVVLGSVVVAVVLTNVFFLIWRYVAPFIGGPQDSLNLFRVSYQMTNFIINVILSVGGLYYYYFELATYHPETTQQGLLGLEETFPICSLQIGFQIWAIPVGVLFVKESKEMLGHHVAVLITIIMPAFLTIGFRWYNPFMFGIIEISSLSLAIMNAFKDRPEWIKAQPEVYKRIRWLFAVSFIFVRWFMYIPRKIQFLRLLFITISTARGKVWFTVFYSFVFLSSVFLAFLQIMWGLLIVKGVLKNFSRKRKTKRS